MEWSAEDHATVLNGVSRLGWLVLKRFSAAYRPSEVLAAFASLSSREFELLRRLRFGTSSNVRDFIQEHCPTFLRALPTTTEHVLEDQNGSPRGRVDWPKTYSRRGQLGGDSSRFVTRPIERTNDSAAGRLVALVLRKIAENNEKLSRTELPELVRASLAADADTARKLLATLKARGVRLPASLTSRDVAPFRKSRREDVVQAVLLYDLHVNLIENANENLLRNLLREEQLAPENHDDLFEIWVLLTFVELHLSEGWEISEAHLIGSDGTPRRPKFTLTKGETVVELFYQILPTEMASSSIYKSVFQEYEFDASVRRPDITVKVSHPDGESRFIIEVKRTRDPAYITESVYKTLGYIADFKNSLGPDAPLAVLVVWEGIKPKGEILPVTPIRIFTAEQFRNMSITY